MTDKKGTAAGFAGTSCVLGHYSENDVIRNADGDIISCGVN